MRYDLPTEVRILQAGLVVNAFGNGAAAPFLIIYLHDVRGVPLALAGLASATSAASALSATLVAGRLADRLGPRPTMMCGLSLSTVAYGLYPFVRQPWHAIGLAVLAGAGIGTWLTMQSALLAQLTPPAMRHIAFAWQRVAANVGLGLGGFAGGVLVTTSRPATFTALFWLNAATFVVYVRFLARIPLPHRHGRDRASAGSYRAVVADRVFVRFTLLNVIVVAGAIALLNALLPVYAKNQGHVSERAIGALFLVNAAAIITLQVPVARRVEGRLRMRTFALMAGLFALAWLLVAAAPAVRSPVTVLVVAILVFSVAECLYDAVQGPLASDLAPPPLLARYMAVVAFSWQFGFIVGPALGAVILAASRVALWPAAAAVCLVAVAMALRLDRLLPDRVRRTPVRESADSEGADLPDPDKEGTRTP